MSRHLQILPSLLYVLTVFAVGMVCGPVRVLVLEPRVGELAAVLIEAPVMIAASYIAALWLCRRYHLQSRAGRLRMGLTALLFLLVLEGAGAIFIRGYGVHELVAHYISPAGLVGLGLYAFFAAMPMVIRPGKQ